MIESFNWVATISESRTNCIAILQKYSSFVSALDHIVTIKVNHVLYFLNLVNNNWSVIQVDNQRIYRFGQLADTNERDNPQKVDN